MDLKGKVKKSIEKDKKKYRIYLYGEEHTEVLSCDFNSGDWSGFNEETITYTPTGMTLKPGIYSEVIEVDFNPEEVEKAGQFVYVLIVTYCDGGTFGRTNGLHHIITATLDTKEAERIAQNIRADEEKYKKDYAGYHEGDKQYDGYSPWIGYFSRLQEMVIYIFKINQQTRYSV